MDDLRDQVDSNKTDRESTPINRRNILRGIATSTAATAFPFASGTAAAQEEKVKIDEVVGNERKTAIHTAVRYSEFQHLRQFFKKHFSRVPDTANAKVYDVAYTDGESGTAVGFKLEYEGSQSNSGNRASIGVTLQNGTPNNAVAGRTLFSENNNLREVEQYIVENGNIEKQSEKIDPSTIDPSTITTQSAACATCKEFYNTACNLECGIGTGLLCAVAGFASFSIGGVACAAAAGLFCKYIGTYGCSITGRRVCRRTGLAC